jgi:hypothetical protein
MTWQAVQVHDAFFRPAEKGFDANRAESMQAPLECRWSCTTGDGPLTPRNGAVRKVAWRGPSLLLYSLMRSVVPCGFA